MGELFEVVEDGPDVVSDSRGTVKLELVEPVAPERDVIEDGVGLDVTEELDDVVEATIVELLDAAVLINELPDDDVAESVGVTTSAVVPVDCAEVSKVAVVDSSANGLLLVGEVAFVAVQKLTNWLN